MGLIKPCYPAYALPGGGFALPPGFPGTFPGQFGDHARDELIPPLLNYAPGDGEDIYGMGPQLPVEQPFYYDVASMLAAGVTAAPFTIWGFQEAVGLPQDLVNGHDCNSDAGQVKYNIPAVGMYVNGSFDGSVKRCMQMGYTGAHDTVLTASSLPAIGLDHWCCFGIFRRGKLTPTANTNICTTRSSNDDGWDIMGSNEFRIESATGQFGTSQFLNHSAFGGYWYYVFCYVDRTANLAGANSPWRVGPTINISGWTTISNNQSFRFGNSFYVNAGFQNAYMAFWSGANAKSIIDNYAANMDVLWKHGRQPVNAPVDQTSQFTAGVSGLYINTVVNEDPVTGTQIAGWTNGNLAYPGATQFPYEYRSELSRPSKLGIASQDTTEGRVTYSDNVSTWWTTSNLGRSNTFADFALGPDGIWAAQPIWSTASPGRLKTPDMTCIAGQIWSMGLFVKRGDAEVADVAGCRLVAWNDNGLSEIDAVTFTATEKWQWIELTALTIPGGCVDVQMWIEVPYTGAQRRIYPYHMTTIGWNSRSMSHPIWYDGTTGRFSYDVQPRLFGTGAGEFIKGARGEIEVVVRATDQRRPADAIIYDTFMAATSGNRRIVGVNSSDQFFLTVYNNAAGLVGTVVSAAVADLTIEHTVVCRWDVDGLPSGDKYEISVDGGAYVGANPAAWAVGDTIVQHYYGWGVGAVAAFVGTIASIRVWELPR